jgi:ATP-dependent DNA ligase
MVLNAQRVFYNSIDAVNHPDKKDIGNLTFNEILTQFKRFESRELTGFSAKKLIASMYHSGDSDTKFIMECLLDKSLKCGIDVKSFNKVAIKTIPVFDLMLCTPSSEKAFKKINWKNACVQKKNDGMRVVICLHKDKPVEYRTRNGLVFDVGNVAIDNALKLAQKALGNVVLDGELFFKDIYGKVLPRKESNGIANKVIKGTKTTCTDDEILFVLWDAIPYDDFFAGYCATEYRKRFDDVQVAVMEIADGMVEVTESQDTDSFEHATEVAQQYIKDGFEGAVVKNWDAVYQNKRVPDCVKIKNEESADLLCIGWLAGMGRCTKMIGSLIVTDATGTVVSNIGTGLSDEARKKNPEEYVGKILDISYNEIIGKKGGTRSLFLPVFNGVRLDKQEPDTI